jgi:EAL domain-containing protein (putative c-di-GMP-specific phosphodiesterase class I)
MKITDWVMATAMKELKNDIDILKKENIKLSFKLSSVHFKQNDIVNNILEIIGKDNVSLIQIKIDEPIISKNLVEAKEKITHFMETGFYVCIDDFGTGKISFLDILDLDFTSVKIPRELIKNVNENKSYAAAVKSLISLAKNLDSYITIEGIESKEQVDALSNYIDDKMFLQGHYFSKPLNANEIKKIM